jgi:HK97 gp10 family phage protein
MINVEANEAQMQKQVQDLIKSFLALPKDIAKKRMSSAIRKATKPFEPALRANTPYHTGSLMRSIKTKSRLYDHGSAGAICFVAGYTMGTLRKRRGQFVIEGSGHHAIIVERGTKARFKKNGAGCGVMPAKRMAQRTLDSTKSQVLGAMVTELATALEKTAAEYAK